MEAKPWADMTSEERLAWRIDKWRNPGVAFANDEAEAEYKGRVDRILAAIELRKTRPGAGASQHGLLAG